ncbi:hypothetical protein GCM10027056_04930 [Glaciibacter psychrotolerans]
MHARERAARFTPTRRRAHNIDNDGIVAHEASLGRDGFVLPAKKRPPAHVPRSSGAQRDSRAQTNRAGPQN